MSQTELESISQYILYLDKMAKLLLPVAALFTLFTVGEFAPVLRRQGYADPGEPLFLTPYINKEEYETGIFTMH